MLLFLKKRKIPSVISLKMSVSEGQWKLPTSNCSAKRFEKCLDNLHSGNGRELNSALDLWIIPTIRWKRWGKKCKWQGNALVQLKNEPFLIYVLHTPAAF